jgi:UDP-N-acetylglucosamine 4,6-dehydratase
VIGIRPGEKLNEILLIDEEARHSKEFDNYFVVEPEFPFWEKDNFREGNYLPVGFRYTSDNNSQWLTNDELKAIVEKV